jgi:hypothetical protein
MAVPMESELKKLMETYVKHPPRKMQGPGYHPISLTEYQRFDFIRQELAKEGVHIPLPTGN